MLGGLIGRKGARNPGIFGIWELARDRLLPTDSYPATTGGRGRSGRCHAGPGCQRCKERKEGRDAGRGVAGPREVSWAARRGKRKGAGWGVRGAGPQPGFQELSLFFSFQIIFFSKAFS